MQIGVILSGGSSKGAYQIGFYKALTDMGLQKYVSAISATSIGAINSYAFLTNQLQQAERLWLSINVKGIFKLRQKNKSEQLISHILDSIIKEKEKIKDPFFITLTQYPSMQPRYFNLQTVETALYKPLLAACISIPALTTSPFKYENGYLWDGGISDNIPIIPLRFSPTDLIIIAHFDPLFKLREGDFPSQKQVICIDYSQCRNFSQNCFNYDTDHIWEMTKEGYRYTLEILKNHLFDKQSLSTKSNKKTYKDVFSPDRLLTLINRTLKIP